VDGLTQSSRILVTLPHWVGDVVMATPALAALRGGCRGAHIAAVAKPKLAELLDGMGLFDEAINHGGRYSLRQAFALAPRIRRGRFDTAVLFTNSFGSALAVKLAGVPRISGYARDMRSLLLTDRIEPPREGGRIVPESMTRYYLRLVRLLGLEAPEAPMRLVATDSDRRKADRALAAAGLAAGRPYVVLIPGASFGPSKMWPTHYYAALGRMIEEARLGQCVALLAPDEAGLAGDFVSDGNGAARPIVTGLSELKGIIAHAVAVVTNDTGPRHIAAALGAPVVTIIGPTDPRWGATGCPHEVTLAKPPECAPCMKPVCGREHECMTAIKPTEVFAALKGLLASCASGRAGVRG